MWLTGDSGMKEFESRSSRSRKPKAKGQSQLAPTPQSSAKDCLRLYFPSQETVARSAGGVNVSLLGDQYSFWPSLAD